jgi:hypothetical protein
MISAVKGVEFVSEKIHLPTTRAGSVKIALLCCKQKAEQP